MKYQTNRASFVPVYSLRSREIILNFLLQIMIRYSTPNIQVLRCRNNSEQTKTFEKDKVSTKIVRFLKEIIHYYYGWSFSFSLYCFDTEARLTSQCCNKYLHYWQPANLSQTHTVQAEWGVYILNEYPTDFECIPYSLNAYPTAWMHTLQWPPNLDLSFRRFCTMHVVDLLGM